METVLDGAYEEPQERIVDIICSGHADSDWGAFFHIRVLYAAKQKGYYQRHCQSSGRLSRDNLDGFK